MTLARRSRGNRLYGFEFPRIFPPDLMNRESVLQVQPELLRSSEILGQTSCHLRGNSALFSNDVVDCRRRNVQLHRKPVGRDAHRFQKLLAKNLSRMHRPTCWAFILDAHIAFPPKRSVVIGYFHIIRIAIAPNETHAILIVDADTVLACPIPTQCFQPVPRRHS